MAMRYISTERIRRKVVWTSRVAALLAIGAAVLLSACGTQVRNGTSSSYLILNSLEGASGSSTAFSTTLESDVVTDTGSKFADSGQATLQLALKDAIGTSPTTNNFITLDSYHVQYSRTDGHNTQGVDVPYAFDSAISGTVSGTLSIGFTLVRLQAKLEAPLAAMSVNNIPITTIAQVTFYGHDQTGRGVSVTGNIQVTFANFAG